MENWLPQYVVRIGRGRYEQQPKAFYAKVLMQRFKSAVILDSHLSFTCHLPPANLLTYQEF